MVHMMNTKIKGFLPLNIDNSVNWKGKEKDHHVETLGKVPVCSGEHTFFPIVGDKKPWQYCIQLISIIFLTHLC